MKLEKNTIYLEDCNKFMEKLDENVFDVIVTSPPYNLNKKYSTYSDNRERADYLSWMNEVAKQSQRVLNDNGSFFLNIGDKPSDPWMSFDVAREFGKYYQLQNVIHWIKHISIPKSYSDTKTNEHNGDISMGHFKPINTNRFLNQCHEYIFHFTKTGNVNLDKLAIGVPYQHESNLTRWKTKNNKRDRGNVWFIRYDNKQGAVKPIKHPAEFPYRLPYLCIKLHGLKEDMLVYDPFMGIGNTAIAAQYLNVPYVGTDIDENYIRHANDRLKEIRDRVDQQRNE